MNPLKEELQKKLLIKLEDLKNVNTKIKFLFSGKEAVLLGDFVLRYQELLFSMYQYQIVLDNMKKISEDFMLPLEEAQKKVKEQQHRVKLQEAFDKLQQSDDKLKEANVEVQIEKQLKLC